MSWWNLGGMNPKYKDFVETHPDKTMLGMMWAFYWRLIVFVIILEVLFVLALGILALLFSVFFHH